MKLFEQTLKRNSDQGFTLVELLIATIIVGIVMGAIYSTYYAQQKSYLAQEEIAAMQQNLRASLFCLERDIRMVGCDPTGSADSGIVTATVDSINFTEDLDGDSSISGDEDITYSLQDLDGDGFGDRLARNGRIIAENIEALDFVYLDEEGNPTGILSNIKSIQVSLLGRTGKGDRGFRNNTTYYNLQNNPIYTASGDNLRRRLLTTEIKCRNLGFRP